MRKVIDISKRLRKESVLIGLSCILFFFYAYTNDGYYHPDEHFQIIEFANYKLGVTGVQDLPWEFKEQIRPSLQPFICLGILNTLNLAGIENSNYQTFVLRFVSSVFCLLILFNFIRKTNYFILDGKSKLFYYFITLFTFFIPLVGVRFSSENYSGLCFVVAISYLHKKNYNPYLLGGILGLSFLFRFQIAFAIIGFALWLWFILRIGYRESLQILGGFALLTLIGVLLDYNFYGNLTITPWNYFEVNIIDKVASSFGTQPWYWYILTLLPFSICILFVGIKFPKNIFIWCIVPFVLAHSIIPHKELRFLFPIVYMIPIVLLIACDEFIAFLKKRKQIARYTIIALFSLGNMLMIILTTSKSAGTARMEIPNYINRNYCNVPTHLIFTVRGNGFQSLKGFLPDYYSNMQNVTSTLIDDLSCYNSTLLKEGRVNLIVLERSELTYLSDTVILDDKQFCNKTYNIPYWMHDGLEALVPSLANKSKILLEQQ